MSRRLFFELRYLFRHAPWDTAVSPPELLAYLETHPPGKALDLGCGTGTNALTMSRHGWQVSAIDFSALAIGVARLKARRAGITIDFRRGDVTRLADLPGPFDFGLDIGCFHSLPDKARPLYAAQLARQIRIGGSVLLYSFLNSTPLASSWPTEESIQQRFSPCFEFVSTARDAEGERTSAWFTLRRSA